MKMPSTGDLHVWRVPVDKLVSYIDDYFKILSPEEMHRAKSYIFRMHYDRFVVRRAVLRSILALYLDMPPRDVPLINNIGGKPKLAFNPPPVYFNLSHSNDWVYYVISARPNVGIDIEFIQAEMMDKDFAQFVLHPKEYSDFEKLSSECQAPFLCQHFSAKEALLKAAGIGLHHPLTEILLDLAQPQSPRIVSFQRGDTQPPKWFLRCLATPGNYRGAVSQSGGFSSIKYFNYTKDCHVR